MNCMKCGRETAENQAFCQECLEGMEKYPVKPGTVVHLPRRREESGSKKGYPRRKAPPTPEEQVKSLKKTVRTLLVTLLVATLLLIVTGYFAVEHLLESDMRFLPGQNYSSVTSADSTLPE